MKYLVDRWNRFLSHITPDDIDYTNYNSSVNIPQLEDTDELGEDSDSSYLYIVQMFHFEIFSNNMPYLLGVYSSEKLAFQEGEAESIRVNEMYIPVIKKSKLDHTLGKPARVVDH